MINEAFISDTDLQSYLKSWSPLALDQAVVHLLKVEHGFICEGSVIPRLKGEVISWYDKENRGWWIKQNTERWVCLTKIMEQSGVWVIGSLHQRKV